MSDGVHVLDGSRRRLSRAVSMLLLAACATGQKSSPRTGAVQSHVYALSADSVLTTTTTVLLQKGWSVERQGDQLGTRWRPDANGSGLGYRVEVERIDAEHCTLHIESVGATSLKNSSIRGMGPDVDASHGRSAWSDVDAPTTLSGPPPGLVMLSRGRDEAMEWALLQQLEPRAAQAYAGADGPSLAPAAGVSADAGTTGLAALAPPPGCEPELPGLKASLAGHRLLLLGDVPGTNEIPAWVGQVACQTARTGLSTVVALELLRADQPWVDTLLASQGTAADRAAFLQLTRSFAARTGRGSAAMLALLARLRTLRDAGLPIRVLAFDEPLTAPDRDRTRAATLERARRADREALLLVLLESAEAQTVLGAEQLPEHAPIGLYLARWGFLPLSLELRSAGGEAWSCASFPRKGCGAVRVEPALRGPQSALGSVTVHAATDARGFSGEFFVGPLTASSAAAP